VKTKRSLSRYGYESRTLTVHRRSNNEQRRTLKVREFESSRKIVLDNASSCVVGTSETANGNDFTNVGRATAQLDCLGHVFDNASALPVAVSETANSVRITCIGCAPVQLDRLGCVLGNARTRLVAISKPAKSVRTTSVGRTPLQLDRLGRVFDNASALPVAVPETANSVRITCIGRASTARPPWPRPWQRPCLCGRNLRACK
jgi:hypothetical protein